MKLSWIYESTQSIYIFFQKKKSLTKTVLFFNQSKFKPRSLRTKKWMRNLELVDISFRWNWWAYIVIWCLPYSAICISSIFELTIIRLCHSRSDLLLCVFLMPSNTIQGLLKWPNSNSCGKRNNMTISEFMWHLLHEMHKF